MEWISTKIRFPKSGEKVLTACKNKNMEDGIWLYELCYYYPDTGWENRDNWEDVLYWAYVDEPERQIVMEQYILKSAVVAEIEKLYNGEIDTYTRNILDRLKSNIDTLEVKEVQEEPVSEGLEEASRNYADNKEYGDDVYFAIKAAFKAGAKWHKERIMAKAVDAKLLEGYLIRQKEVTHPLHVGYKVKVIVIKEDKL